MNQERIDTKYFADLSLKQRTGYGIKHAEAVEPLQLHEKTQEEKVAEAAGSLLTQEVTYSA